MLLIKNGRVIDPASGTDATLDVLIDSDRILRKRAHHSRQKAPKFSTPRA